MTSFDLYLRFRPPFVATKAAQTKGLPSEKVAERHSNGKNSAYCPVLVRFVQVIVPFRLASIALSLEDRETAET
jgi:hypothetical protein